MAITITDADLLTQLNSEEVIRFTDADGRLIGRFVRLRGGLPHGIRSWLSADRMVDLYRPMPTGKSLAEILEHLKTLG